MSQLLGIAIVVCKAVVCIFKPNPGFLDRETKNMREGNVFFFLSSGDPCTPCDFDLIGLAGVAVVGHDIEPDPMTNWEADNMLTAIWRDDYSRQKLFV